MNVSVRPGLTSANANAKALAHIQHAGQVDEDRRPYVEHLERVTEAAERRARHAQAAGLAVDPDEVAQAAWLHDVIEDTPTSTDDLRQAGYSASVVEMVALLTKPKTSATYEECIAAIIASGNLGAILVMLPDNEDNASPDRPLQAASALPARYAASMGRLMKAAESLGYREGDA